MWVVDRKLKFSLEWPYVHGMEGTVLFSVFWATSYLAVLLGTGNAPHNYPLRFGTRRRTLCNAVALNLRNWYDFATLNFMYSNTFCLSS